METFKLGIDGMSCGGCVISVEKALGRVPGVKRVEVSLEKKEAVVEGDGLEREQLAEAITDAGYDVR
ncbi:MAG: heavy metal-associated domain-containing protein [Pseudomonadota bacterium]|nr:heavy metal-associated domain-containing protein [Pseudomonadota bacterium]